MVVGLSGNVVAQDGPGRPLDVVVTLQPWASLTSSIAGEFATVATLLPAGASPHAFDPLPSQAVALAGADLVVINGGLDDWLMRLLEATASNALRLTLLDEIDFTAIEDEHDHDDEDDHASDNDVVNPHIWLDPLLAAQAAGPIAEALAKLDPEHAEDFRSNAADLRMALLLLDSELHVMLQPVAGTPIVPFHDAWVYFARRYALDIVATLEPFPGREPSAAYLAATVAQIRSSGVSVIFTERQLNDRTAVVVAESAGVELAVLDPIGGAPGPEDYFDLLRWNAAAIFEALETE
ncbi:MAG TPA: metal ABC transporter substrate-binding protein [Trueperaceae bacterium]|nr:metal ABC transporter substrate-binding protein [Trueperaceae bacterium]